MVLVVAMKTLSEQLGKPVRFHWVGWHNKDGHYIPGYDSRDPKVITHQLRAMKEVGGEEFGVIALTYGHLMSPFIHQAVMGMCHQCNAQGVPFSLCYDPWTVKNADGSAVSTAEKNNRMIAELKFEDTQFMLHSDAYEQGKPVLDFATGCDKAAVTSAVPEIEYWMNGVDYDWVKIPPVANKTKLPCVYLQFDDGTVPDRNKSIRDQSKPARIIPSLAGNTFHGQNIEGGPVVQFCTWNDYSETTAIEPFAAMIWGRI